MLATKSLKVGSVVRLKGEIIRYDGYGCWYIIFNNADAESCLTEAELSHAELVSEPEPTCGKDFANSLKAYIKKSHGGMIMSSGWIDGWLDEHTEPSPFDKMEDTPGDKDSCKKQ